MASWVQLMGFTSTESPLSAGAVQSLMEQPNPERIGDMYQIASATDQCCCDTMCCDPSNPPGPTPGCDNGVQDCYSCC